jgi:hypothetical protein
MGLAKAAVSKDTKGDYTRKDGHDDMHFPDPML